MYWRAQACSVNYKPYTNKSLKGMKRKWGPGHLSSHSCSYVGWTAACSWMLMWFPSPQISLTEHLPVSAKINHLNKGQFFSLLMLSWLILTAKGWEGAHRAVLTPRTWGGSGSLCRQTFFSVIVMLLHWIITGLSKGKNKHNVFLPRRTEKIAYIHIYNVQHKYLKLFNIYKTTCILIRRAYTTTREQLFVGLVHDNQSLKQNKFTLCSHICPITKDTALLLPKLL